MSFFRKVSPTEITYLARDTKEFSLFVNRCIGEGHGTLDINDWKEAVQIATDANPGIRLKLKGRWGWRYWDDDAPMPEVIKISTRWDGKGSLGAPKEVFSGLSIDVRRESAAKIFLLEGGDKPRVVFCVHHAVTDGMGLRRWMKDISRALSNKKPFGAAGTINDFEIAATTQYVPSKLLRGRCAPVTEVSTKPDLSGVCWRTIRWQGNSNRILPKVVILINQLTRELHPEGKVLVRIPSDLRSYLDAQDPYTLANASGVFDLLLEEDMDIGEVEAKILTLKSCLADLSVFPDKARYTAWLPRQLFMAKPKFIAQRHSQGYCSYTAMVTYGGKFNYAAHSTDKFEMESIYLAPLEIDDRCYVGIITDNEGVNFTIGIPNALADETQLHELCARFTEKLNVIDAA